MSRTVVVSGGGTGMGKAIAARFVAEGEQVVIIGRRAGILAAAAGEFAGGCRGSVQWYAGDLGSPEEAERVAAELPMTVDVLVNNAGGIGSRGSAGDGLGGVAGRRSSEEGDGGGHVVGTASPAHERLGHEAMVTLLGHGVTDRFSRSMGVRYLGAEQGTEGISRRALAALQAMAVAGE